MAAGAGELLICLQKKPVDSGVGATRLQPRDHPLPSILGPSWLKTVGSTFFGSNSGQGKELWRGSAGQELLFPQMRPGLQRAQRRERGEMTGTLSSLC